MIPALSYLREINLLSLFFRFILACFCGGIVGFGRGKRQHAAGLRTHLLVCVGAASTMILNQYLVAVYQSGDASRLGAQVISGIGFLGAGTILVRGENHVTGLTTAAGLWASACMGLLIGSGYYEAALILLLILCLILFVLNSVDGKFVKSTHYSLYLECAPELPLSAILRVMSQENVKVTSVQEMPGGKGTVCSLRLSVEHRSKNTNRQTLIALLENTPGISFVMKL